MGNYEIFATPHFSHVYCPKHYGIPMQELHNGFLGEKLWYCKGCDAPYCLAPKKLRSNQYNRDELNEQTVPKPKNKIGGE